MRNALYFLVLLTIMSCKSQTKDEPINDLRMEINLLNKFLVDKGYKTPNSHDFSQRCLDYFGININSTNETYMQPVGESSYGISKEKFFLNTFSESIFYNPNSAGESFNYDEGKMILYKNDNIDSQKFLAYNRILFNDNISSLSYFMQNKADAFEVVVNFDYEKNQSMFDLAIDQLNEMNNINKHNLFHIIYYNYEKKGIKKTIINKLFEKDYISTMDNVVESLYENWEFEHSMKDEALVFIIKKFIEFDKNNPKDRLDEQKSNSYLYNFLAKDTKLHERLVNEDYYNSSELKELVNSYFVINDSKEYDNDDSILAKIEDKDGFVNVRKDQDVNSEIIGKINSNEEVYTYPSSSDMWWVKTKEGNVGYVHKSRIKILKK